MTRRWNYFQTKLLSVHVTGSPARSQGQCDSPIKQPIRSAKAAPTAQHDMKGTVPNTAAQ